MENDNLHEYGKQISDKIPDIAFDWYARLIPGLICISLLILLGNIELEYVSKNPLIILFVAYIIGHIIQPFSSGILQKKYPNLRVKKGPLLSKAYSELIGFFSCLIFAIMVFIIKIFYPLFTKTPYITIEILINLFAILLFAIAVRLRKKAYDRKL